MLRNIRIGLFSILLLINCYKCQVDLTRELLKQWLGLSEDELNLANEIHLRNKNIATIDLQTFNGLTNLETLDLSWNQIQKIEIFIGLTSLQTLNLLGNQINMIYPLANTRPFF